MFAVACGDGGDDMSGDPHGDGSQGGMDAAGSHADGGSAQQDAGGLDVPDGGEEPGGDSGSSADPDAAVPAMDASVHDSGSTEDAGGSGGGDECRFDTDCGEGQWCRGQHCVDAIYCDTDEACGPSLVCDGNRRLCTVCADDDDCPGDHHCVDRELCLPFPSCVNSLGCEPGWVCDTSAGECFECIQDTDCDDGNVCVRHQCELACDSDNDCTASSLLCRSEAAEPSHCAECTADVDCDPAQHCADGACKDDVCTSGEQRCGAGTFCPYDCPDPSNFLCFYCDQGYFQGIGLATCNEQGSGFATTVEECVQGAASCIQGAGVATCEPRVCSAGKVECGDDGAAVIQCSYDGLSVLSSTECGSGSVCDPEPTCSAPGELPDGGAPDAGEPCDAPEGAACMPVVCVPGSYRCLNTISEQCNDLGTAWKYFADCTGQSYCSDASGRCLPVEQTSNIGSTSSQQASGAGAYGMFFEMTDPRELIELSFPYTINGVTTYQLTFFVYQLTAEGTYTRIWSSSATSGNACSSVACSTSLDGVRLEQGEQYLLGMHGNAPNQTFRYGAGLSGTSLPGAKIKGGYHVQGADAPAEVLTSPVLQERVYRMTATTGEPD